MDSKNKAICVFSGGIDSTTLLYQLIKDNFRISAVGFDYGQRHKKELNFACDTCKDLGVSYKIIKLPFFNEIAPSELTRNEQDFLTNEKLDSLTNQVIVPNRNMVMLSLATSYAISLNINKIFYGAHIGDREVFPDCREEFVESMRNSIRLSHTEDIELYAPFLKLDKTEIIQLGFSLGVDYSKTWSCYKGLEEVCGSCLACKERNRAFRYIGISDPLIEKS